MVVFYHLVGTGDPAMHRRISHTLNTLRQGLAAKLGGDFIDPLAAWPVTHGARAVS